ncbi:MAG: hypothetical protein Q7S57_02710 [bacterium]|nr:hypothetical protein [bacterium]
MKLIKYNRTMLLGISTGLFISAIFVFFFTALFSYTSETNQFAVILFAISLLIFYITETVKLNNKPEQTKPTGGKIIHTILLIATPIFCSVVLIQGDIRSWFLILISVLLAWVIIK